MIPCKFLPFSGFEKYATLVRAIKNTLKWNSLGYQKYNDDIPFYLYFGATHGFYKVKHYDYLEEETVLSRNYQQLSVNGGIIINLFKSTRITGHAELVTLGYQIGDFDLRGQWKQFFGTSNRKINNIIKVEICWSEYKKSPEILGFRGFWS